MIIKKFIFTFMCVLYTSYSFAQTNSSIILSRLDKIERKLDFEIGKLNKLQNDFDSTRLLTITHQELIDSICEIISNNRKDIESVTDSLGSSIKGTNSLLQTKAESSEVKSKTLWGIIAIGTILLLGLLTYFLLHRKIKKGNADVEALRKKAEKINEDILNQFSLEMVEMQKISQSLKTMSETTANNGQNVETDHSLIKTLADRITFMEMTLYKMDPNVRGHKHLSRSVQQMKDNLLANGYEIVEMLGKPYHDGMKVIANFIEDEDLEEGKQVITGIIKPQINYNGVMIQSAQITVSQNL